MRCFTIKCLSTALSPITHMSGTKGNVGIIAREAVTTDHGTVFVPFLSGNALRHRLVRRPGMLWLADEYQLRDRMPLAVFNFLVHGGNLTESTARENTGRIREMHRTWPLLRLLGGSLPDQIVAGSLDVWRGKLVCEENRRHLSDVFGELPAQRLYPAETFVSEYQYTRGDAAKLGLNSDDAVIEDSNLMIINGQCIQRGAVFAHGFVLKHTSELELGALFWSLRLWQQAGATIGGMAARGHGRLLLQLLADGFNQKKLCRQYVEYVRDNKKKAIAWLEDAWG